MAPNCSLFAIMPLVTGGPEVKLFHSSWNFTLAYLPSFGRYFSRSLSSRITTPVVTVLVVVSCVPMPMVTVCAEAAPSPPRSIASVIKGIRAGGARSVMNLLLCRAWIIAAPRAADIKGPSHIAVD